MRPTLSSLAIASLIGSSALAGPPAPENPAKTIDLAPWIREWPSGVSTTGLGRAIAGDFSGDRTPDVWQQASDTLVLYLDPSYMESSVEFTLTASSIARFPAVAPATKDRLLVSTSSGLSLVEFTPNATNPITTTSVTTATAWQSVRSLSCCDLNRDGRMDILAINAAGTTLVRLIDDGSGGYTTASNINLGINATEAFGMTYNTGEDPQVAVLTSSWFFIVQQSGVRSRLIATTSSFGHIARITQVDAGELAIPDCVAWLQEVPGGGEKQVALVDNRATLQTPVSLDDLDAAVIFSGDVDGNGSDDFGIVTNAKERFTFLNHRSAVLLTVDRFAGPSDDAILISDATAAAAWTATPVFADMNFDRQADFFTVDRNKPTALSIQTNPVDAPTVPPGVYKISNSEYPQHPCFVRGDFYSRSYFLNCATATSGTGVLMLSLDDPWNISAGDLTDWKLEVVMYRQEDNVTGVNPDAVAHYEYPLDGNVDYSAYGAGGAVWGFPLEINDFQPLFHEKFFVVLRPLPPDGATPLTEYVAGVTSEDINVDNHSTIYMTGLPGAWPASIDFDTWDRTSNCQGYGTSRKDTSGAVPLLRVPRYTGGVTPNPQTQPYPGPPPEPVPHPQQ